MRKTYGQSQHLPCPFCGGQATTKNAQQLPTCVQHKNDEINLKCACGDYLDPKESKYGTFFTCMSCGAVSYAKALEINNLPLKGIEEL